MPASTSLTAPLCLAAVALLITACGGSSTSPAAGSRDTLSLVVGFYPLEFVSERIGGEDVEVVNLTPVGGEPHDIELSPRDVAAVSEADLVVYLRGFSPSLDDAVDAQASGTALEVGEVVDLDLGPVSDDDHDHGAERDDAAQDPHFWLDPTRLGTLGAAVAERLAGLDEESADDYREAADTLTAELDTLDTELSTGLAECRSRDLVTSHAAFGYLADRYDLRQHAIAGLTPETEPAPGEIADLAAEVRELGVTTVYSETLGSGDLARTVAEETGTSTAVLDPLEGLTDDSGADYLSVMRDNLTTLRVGQECR